MFIAGLLGLLSALRTDFRNNGQKKVSLAKWHRIFIVIGHFVVFANFCVPLVYRIREWQGDWPFTIFCIVMASAVGVTGILFTIWTNGYIKECKDEHELVMTGRSDSPISPTPESEMGTREEAEV